MTVRILLVPVLNYFGGTSVTQEYTLFVPGSYTGGLSVPLRPAIDKLSNLEHFYNRPDLIAVRQMDHVLAVWDDQGTTADEIYLHTSSLIDDYFGDLI